MCLRVLLGTGAGGEETPPSLRQVLLEEPPRMMEQEEKLFRGDLQDTRLRGTPGTGEAASSGDLAVLALWGLRSCPPQPRAELPHPVEPSRVLCGGCCAHRQALVWFWLGEGPCWVAERDQQLSAAQSGSVSVPSYFAPLVRC